MTMPPDPVPDGVDGADTELPVVRVTCDPAGAVVQLRVRGCWDTRLFLAVRTAVLKTLVEHPAAVILDLRAVRDATASSAPLWFTLHRAAQASRPPVRLAVCVQPHTPLAVRLHRLGGARFLPVFATVAQARTGLAAGRAVPEQLQRQLSASAEAASQATVLAAEACRAWSLPRLAAPARLVLRELVVNAVQHAGTDLLVTVARRDQGLYLAVRDGSLVLPRRLPTAPGLPGAPRRERGQGLLAVEAVASAWGALPTVDGTGKVVWAIVRPCRTPPR
jgi:anti-sigma regulatory factor (Ser/Thr protein kinase)